MRTPPQALNVSAEKAGGGSITILRMTGSIDADTSPIARRALDPVINDGSGHMVINLNQVEYVDSTGLMLLADAFARLSRNKRRLVLACTNPRVLKLLTITGLLKVFTIRPTEQESLAALE